VRAKTKAKLYEIKNRNGSLTYRVDLGKGPDGKRMTRGFSTRDEAEEFKHKIDAKIEDKASASALSDLTQAEKYDMLAARERLINCNASLPEAVDFFLKHNAAHKAVLTVDEALAEWQTEKAKLRLSQKYQESAARNFFRPFAKKFGKKKLNLISSREIERYVFRHKTWSPQTKASHLNYLRTFFSFFLKQGNISLNPVIGISKPKIVEGEPRLLSVSNTNTLLNFALNNEYKEECAAMTLVLFCGIRVDEVDRLTWDAVSLQAGTVTIQGKDSKRGRKRINTISSNALEWLKMCQPDNKSGRIGPSDYRQRMKRLRTRVKGANGAFAYPQNAMRHSFAGYHLANHEDAIKTAFLLGHPNPNLLHSTYKELTSKQQAAQFWNILPEKLAQEIEIKKTLEKENNQKLKVKILQLGKNC
jgi:site-specific recombinase XerC